MRRRTFLALGAGALALPARLASAADPDRFFIFIFCNGGWDQTRVFAPVFGDAFTPETRADPLSIGGIDFVDHPDRPSVTAFFENHASRTCLLNGIEVQSVAHASATQRIFSGNLGDDWGSRIAAATPGLLMPHVLVSGPGFTEALTDRVVRVGETGQLGPLLDDSWPSDVATSGLDPVAQGLVDEYVSTRAQGEVGERLSDLEWLMASAGSLPESGNSLSTLTNKLALPLAGFERGLTSVATVEFLGLNDMGWDQHSDLVVQTLQFERLFSQLDDLMEELEVRGLRDKTTVIVFSEMGRNPTMNSNGGKDHWTFTSAMFVGAGIAGGQTLGGWTEECLGLPIDPDTGGEGDLAMHGVDFGATVLALAGLDPPGGATAVRAVVG